MIIKPWGYALWEGIQSALDQMLKDTGHVNAYFPLLIPLSFLEKEAEHVEGFAKECAVVTHHRLKAGEKGGLVPDGLLEEPYVIRPTSETVIGDAYMRWIQSYRDLPILINQWANVMRWELRPRVFLRTSEFLWQEGHTAHATKEEAIHETLKILDLYSDLVENYLAIPVLKGSKTAGERFPGAEATYSIEAMMQDGRALQAGTSHFLGQNFAKAMGIQFQSQEGQQEFVWTTSWGVSTRLIGGLIMTHSDDNGLVLPPKVAPTQVVLLPVLRGGESQAEVMAYAERLHSQLKETSYDDLPIRVDVDRTDRRGGEKVWHHIKRGVPIRLEVGPREMEADSVSLTRRDKAPKDRVTLSRGEAVSEIPRILSEIQVGLLEKARQFRSLNTVEIDSLADFQEFFAREHGSSLTTGGGFAWAHWNEAAEGHETLVQYKVTPRCLSLESGQEGRECIFTGRPATHRVVFAKSY